MLLSLLLTAAPFVVGPEYPGLEQRITQKTDTDLGKKGLTACGFKNTTSAPALSFTLTTKQPGLTLELAETNNGGVLVRGRQLLCVSPGMTDVEDPGTYELYLLDGNDTPFATAATVRLGFPARMAAAALAKTKVTLAAAGPNPVYGRAPKAPAQDPATAGVRCAKGWVRPVALLEVETASSFTVRGSGVDYWVVKANGECARASRVDLEPGQHALWSDQRERELEFEVRDDERGMAVAAQLPTLRVDTLPAVIRVKAVEEKLERNRSECPFGERTPAFVLEAGDRQGLTLLPVAGQTNVIIDVVGDRLRACGSEAPDLTRPGRAFVYVSVTKGAAGDVLIAARDGTPIDPRWRSGAPDAPSDIAERATGWHFPFWRAPDRDITPLFEAAPAGLFVFLEKEINGVPTTEPLLVSEVEDGKVNVFRITGQVLSRVRPGALTTQVPETLTFPALAPLQPAQTADDAWSAAGTDDEARVAAWRKQEAAFDACVSRYMAKNDPSWGKSYKLVYVRSGRDVSDVMFERADQACGLSKLEGVRKKFVADLNAARAKRRAAFIPSLRKKLGR